MASIEFPLRRVIVAGGFAVAVAIAPAIGFLAGPTPTGTQNVACAAGLEEDPYTYACVPHTVPGGVGGATGAPSEQELTACSGAHRVAVPGAEPLRHTGRHGAQRRHHGSSESLSRGHCWLRGGSALA